MIDNIHIVAKYFDRGPGRLAYTLGRGLSELGVAEVSIDETNNVACLQWGEDWPDVKKLSGRQVLIGPNYSNDHIVPYIDQLDNFIAPSEWVRQKHISDPVLKGKSVHVWSGGVDVDVWTPNRQKDRCIVYVKNRPDSDVQKLIQSLSQCSSSGFKEAVVFKYGNYHELDFLECAKSAAFAILLTNTESQGYAYMQLLSAGVPCLVFNQDTLYSSPDQPIQSWPATSVPYFDERCGLIEKEISKETIEKFFSVPLQSWDPRSYILENHTIEKSTKKYLKLLSEVSPL